MRAVLESDDEDTTATDDVTRSRGPADDVTKSGGDVIKNKGALADTVDSQETDSQALSDSQTQHEDNNKHTRIRNNSLQKDTNRLAGMCLCFNGEALQCFLLVVAIPRDSFLMINLWRFNYTILRMVTENKISVKWLMDCSTLLHCFCYRFKDVGQFGQNSRYEYTVCV